MPISVSTFFLPASSSVPFILEDIYFRGGFRVLPSVSERNALKAATKKPGMLVHTQLENTLWKLETDGSWSVLLDSVSGNYVDKNGDSMDGPLFARVPSLDDSDPFVDSELIPQGEVKALMAPTTLQVMSLNQRVEDIEEGSYIHEQLSSNTQWVINHSLETTNIVIQIVDDNGNTVLPATIDKVDGNTLVVTFSTAKLGKAFLIRL